MKSFTFFLVLGLSVSVYAKYEKTEAGLQAPGFNSQKKLTRKIAAQNAFDALASLNKLDELNRVQSSNSGQLGFTDTSGALTRKNKKTVPSRKGISNSKEISSK